ncbi:MAG: dTMP kinase [Lentisphaerae bacterium]|nr:dTMP kinase [Lentisphaerota bacterium]
MTVRGFFITFEGPEGAGKTTQLKLLEPWLKQHERQCLITREPGGTPLAEIIRKTVKHHNSEEPVFKQTELLLFAASRAQHVNYRIRPALEAGMFVLCDRFTDSTMAYQGYARHGDIEFIRHLNAFCIGECIPDLTVLLDLDPENGRLRTAKRAETQGVHDRLEIENIEFHRRVREGYLELAAQEPQRFAVVPADQSPELIHNMITSIFRDRFKI